MPSSDLYTKEYTRTPFDERYMDIYCPECGWCGRVSYAPYSILRTAFTPLAQLDEQKEAAIQSVIDKHEKDSHEVLIKLITESST